MRQMQNSPEVRNHALVTRICDELGENGWSAEHMSRIGLVRKVYRRIFLRDLPSVVLCGPHEASFDSVQDIVGQHEGFSGALYWRVLLRNRTVRTIYEVRIVSAWLGNDQTRMYSERINKVDPVLQKELERTLAAIRSD